MALLLGLLCGLLLGSRAGLGLAGGGRQRARGTRCRPERGCVSCAAALAQRSPLEPESPGWPGFGDTTTAKEFTTQNQKSQDVGFWEGEVVRELSVEEQIKRNRYYDEDEDEE